MLRSGMFKQGVRAIRRVFWQDTLLLQSDGCIDRANEFRIFLTFTYESARAAEQYIQFVLWRLAAAANRKVATNAPVKHSDPVGGSIERSAMNLVD